MAKFININSEIFTSKNPHIDYKPEIKMIDKHILCLIVWTAQTIVNYVSGESLSRSAWLEYF